MDVISISDTDSSNKSTVLLEFGEDEVEQLEHAIKCQQRSQNNEVEVVTLSSQSQQSTERCPVTWTHSPRKSNLKLLTSNSFCSPSPRSKVSKWLIGNDQQNPSAVVERPLPEISDSLLNNLSSTSFTSFSSVSTNNNRSSILVRQDYKKSINVNPVPEKVFLASSRFVNDVVMENKSVIYLESGGGSSRVSNILNGSHNKNKYVAPKESQLCNTSQEIVNSMPNSQTAIASDFQPQYWGMEETVPHMEMPRISTPQSVRNMHNLVENMTSLCDSQPTFKSKPATNVPLSPETQKKNELCQYLKLMNMNPSDQKTVGLRQNRRSSRVKHLALMSERRELERKLNSEIRDPDRKKTSKTSDSDSRHSTDSDSSKGLKLPITKASEPVDLPPLPKTPTRKDAPSRKSSLDQPRQKIHHKTAEKSNANKMPSKFLQVPEISTTSVAKSKTPIDTVTQQNSSVENVNVDKKKNSFIRRPPSNRSRKTDKENDSSSTSSSDVVTRKSFMQLCFDIKGFRMSNAAQTNSYKPMSREVASRTHLPFSLAGTTTNIPNTTVDFDDSIKSIIDAPSLRNLVSCLKNRQAKNITHKKTKPKAEKAEAFRNNIKRKLKYKSRKPGDEKVFVKKRKVQDPENSPKRKVPKLNGLLSKMKLKKRNKNGGTELKKLSVKSTKDIHKKKMYADPKHVNRLRSRGRLKQIGIKTILMKQERKKAAKKNFKPSSQMNLAGVKHKDFKSTELIQHGYEAAIEIKDVTSTVVKQAPGSPDKQKKCELLPTTSYTNILLSSSRNNKPKVDLDLFKNLTPEHRKALFESKKFLMLKAKESTVNSSASPTKTAPSFIKSDGSMEGQDVIVKKQLPVQELKAVPPCYGFERAEIYTDELKKMNNACAAVCKSAFRPVLRESFSRQALAEPEPNRPSLEDMEVDQLMSSKRRKDQATQIGSESPEATGSDVVVTDVNPEPTDQLHRTSSSLPASTNSWSLQTVESDPESSNCTSKPDVVQISYTSPTCEPELLISDSIVEISSSTREADVEVCPNGYTFSESSQPEIVNISHIQPTTCEYVQLGLNTDKEVKSLHHCLTQPRKKQKERSRETSPSTQQNWEENFQADGAPKTDRKVSQSHTIYLSNENGAIMNAYYLDYNLIVVQELVVSFWNQTPLGNVLGTQNMWIRNGNIQRLVLGNGCVHKDSSETVISLDDSMAYVELWTKEHKSDKRERPVADIFVAIYLRLNRSRPDKRVLQLENINGYASDVQYIVLRNSRNIIVSWNVNADSTSSTIIHCYQLSPDYQTVTSIREMQNVSHYVSSLHNIEDCDSLIMGCGDDKITLWDVEHGYIIATISLMVTKQQPRILWAKCDRGFLFTLHHFKDGLLSLIAVNSFDSTWKKLQTYKPTQEHDNLLGVCMENGLVVAFYDTGVLCWKAETGDLIVEDSYEDSVFLPFGKYVVVVLKNQVHVRHALEYLVTIEDS